MVWPQGGTEGESASGQLGQDTEVVMCFNSK